MAKRPSRRELQRQFDLLATKWETELQRAFFSAVSEIASTAELGRIVKALEIGDIDAAIRALHLESAAFRMLDRAKEAAFEAGGRKTVEYMPALRDAAGQQVVIRFDIRNIRAEQYLSGRAGTNIAQGRMSDRLYRDMVESSRTTLTEGLRAGRNPRSVALDLVGRIDRTTGRRVGGTIGLSGPQQQAVTRARLAMESGNVQGMERYLGYARRDKRFDATVLKAIKEKRPISKDMVDRIAGRYSDRLLQLRGETIARTETLQALSTSQDIAYRSAIDSGAIQSQQVKKQWISTADNRVRDTHRAINGERVGIDDTFSNGLRYPHQEGAPADQVVNCRCTAQYLVDFLDGVS